LFRLHGQVAIITGAASGIGAATARLFAREGADVVLATYTPDGHDVRAVQDSVTQAGKTALVVETDVRSREDVSRLARTAVEHLGRIDTVVANAAIARRRAATAMTEAEWDDLMSVDLGGVWRTFQAAAPYMVEAGGGRLLTTTSTAGTLEGWEEHAHYCAAKAGLTGLVRAMAAELGPHGINVNAVAPGIIETPQTLDPVNSLGAAGIAATALRQPVRRVGQPEDIANAFVFLASPESSFITGQVLVVDGGRSLLGG
jgi:3-oxoacyl-[acyl-carrier protein] reductase